LRPSSASCCRIGAGEASRPRPPAGGAGRFEIAERLDAPLEIVLVRKIGGSLATRAGARRGCRRLRAQLVINDALAAQLAVSESYITTETARQLKEIERRRRTYLSD
jgi:predicted phosphoribosyltransferase